MDHTEPTIKRPRVSLIPHTPDGPPELWFGRFSTVKYVFNRATALYWIDILYAYVRKTEPTGNDINYTMSGDE